LYIGEKLWTVLPAGAIVQQHLASFKEFRHRQAPAGFNPLGLVEALLRAAAQRQGNESGASTVKGAGRLMARPIRR
jgi:arylsulfatase